ncbi:hypothetical protein GP486_005751 [Trichoglossum hirsutum]|uniref:Uncharacterized protein n=1 Tax=Trichoglossum hirsutum TaxID=265104 RepID=A0A9P8L8M9_9PEZI|nr:hypothetical protein GP486_005751 [Trichoglossum hirsutum]
METSSRKRAHTKHSVNGDSDSASSVKRRRNTVNSQQKVQVPQGGEFNTYGDVLAQAGGEENSIGENSISGSDISFGGEQLETGSDSGSPVLSPEQTDVTRTVPRVNWNAGAKSKIRTTLGTGKGTRLKPSQLEAQTSPSRLMQPDHPMSGAKENEPSQELKVEGSNPISSSADPELCVLSNTSREQGVAVAKRLENTYVQGLTASMVSSGDDSKRSSTPPPRLEGTASNFEVPMTAREGDEMETKIQNKLAGSRDLSSPRPWLSSDAYTIICRFVHRLPNEHERCKRISRQELYKCKHLNFESEDFKALPQEVQDGSLEKLRAHLFSFDLDLPQRRDEPELEQLVAAKYTGDSICHDPEDQAEAVFLRHLDEQTLADPERRKAIHETETAFTKCIIEAYQYDHLMCTLLTPDERYEKGIGSLQHIHPHRTPQGYREYILGKCNRFLMDLENPGNTGMAKLQRMTKMDYDKIICEYGDPLVQETEDNEDGDAVTLSGRKKSEQLEYGCVHDNPSRRSGSSHAESSSNPNLKREIHEVEVSYWRDQISREQYNERRWKLYTADEVKEKALEWPRRRVYSPAGYRDRELDYPASCTEPCCMEQGDLNDVLLKFGLDIEGAEEEAAAKERFRERIETEFPDVETRQAEYRRWEKIREVEADFHHNRISRGEYNERRCSLYTNSEMEERKIEWPRCQSPAGRREDFFEVRDEPSYEARMEFHFPYPLEYEDISDEVQLCELCASLIEQRKAEDSESEKARAAEAKAKRDTARANKALGRKLLEVDKAKKKKKKKKDNLQAMHGDAQTAKGTASDKKGIKGPLAGRPQIPSLPNPTEASGPGVELVESPKNSPASQNARVAADKQHGLFDGNSKGSKSEGKVSEAGMNSAKPQHTDKSEPIPEYKPATIWKSKMDFEASLSSKRSPPELHMVPPQPMTISDLLAPEKQLQSRYFAIEQTSCGISGNENDLARCLVCVGQGHTADNCPELTTLNLKNFSDRLLPALPVVVALAEAIRNGEMTENLQAALFAFTFRTAIMLVPPLVNLGHPHKVTTALL